MGNPLNYRDGMSFAWENGRWLKTITKNGNDIEMKYDINGMRTQKGNTYYYYDTDNNLIAMVKGNDTLHFYYDSNNSPIAFTRNNVMYYYVKGNSTSLATTNPLRYSGYVYDDETRLYYLQSCYYDPVTERFLNSDDMVFF